MEIDKSGNGFISVPYNSFIEENGEYLLIAEYKDGVSRPKVYYVEYIVERLDISANVDFVDGDGQLAINVLMLEEDGRSMRDIPKDVILTVNEIKLIDDGTYITHGDPPQTISESYYRNEYPYNKSGNYLINITLENTRVNPNSDSPYLAIKEI